MQAAHMAHIRGMFEKGALEGAGPVIGSANLRGVFVFQTESLARAQALAGADPTITGGLLSLDLHTWIGPVGIGGEYRAAKRANAQAPDHMIDMWLVVLKKGAHWTPSASACDPFTDEGELRGICLYRAESREQARRLIEAEPAVASGQLAYELHAWKVAEGVIPSAK